MENFEGINKIPVSLEETPEEIFVPKKKPEEEPLWVGKEEKEKRAGEEIAREYQNTMNKMNETIESFETGRRGY